MKIVASSFGSAGDFLPTLAVGAALRRRGHEVQFVGNPFYVLHRVLSDDSMGRRATRAGMRFAEERDGADSAADDREPRHAAACPRSVG